MAILKKPTAPKSNHNVTEDKPTGGFGSAWAKSKPSTGGMSLPYAVYEAFLDHAGIIEDQNSEKVTAWFGYRVVAHDKLEGRKGRTFYTLVSKTGEFNEVGMDILKRDLVRLGAEDAMDEVNDIEGLKKLLAEIAEQRLWVIIESKRVKGYDTVTIQDVPEQEGAPEYTFTDED